MSALDCGDRFFNPGAPEDDVIVLDREGKHFSELELREDNLYAKSRCYIFFFFVTSNDGDYEGTCQWPSGLMSERIFEDAEEFWLGSLMDMVGAYFDEDTAGKSARFLLLLEGDSDGKTDMRWTRCVGGFDFAHLYTITGGTPPWRRHLRSV